MEQKFFPAIYKVDLYRSSCLLIEFTFSKTNPPNPFAYSEYSYILKCFNHCSRIQYLAHTSPQWATRFHYSEECLIHIFGPYRDQVWPRSRWMKFPSLSWRNTATRNRAIVRTRGFAMCDSSFASLAVVHCVLSRVQRRRAAFEQPSPTSLCLWPS